MGDIQHTINCKVQIKIQYKKTTELAMDLVLYLESHKVTKMKTYENK